MYIKNMIIACLIATSYILSGCISVDSGYPIKNEDVMKKQNRARITLEKIENTQIPKEEIPQSDDIRSRTDKFIQAYHKVQQEKNKLKKIGEQLKNATAESEENLMKQLCDTKKELKIANNAFHKAQLMRKISGDSILLK